MPDYEQDIILLNRLKAGDEGALTYLYNKYRKWLMLVALTVLGNSKDLEAQDIVQEFFIDFWEKKLYRKIGPPFTVRTYLYRCIYNRCLNKIRDNKVEQKRRDRFSLITEHLQLPEHRVENKELYLQLDAAIRDVPPLSAQVFRLTYIDHKSRKEIASEMGISPHTVRNQLVRAIAILRNRLKNM